MSNTLKRSVVAIAITSALAGCAVVPPNSGENPNDPWETFNRQTHAFNMTMDEYVLHPIAKGYADYIPTPVQEGVSNFFSNLGKGNVSGLGMLGLVASALLVFGRFGWLGKIGGLLLGMMLIGNNSKIEQTQPVGQTPQEEQERQGGRRR